MKNNELRELFYKEQCENDEDGLHIYENKGKLVADWWLSKLDLLAMEAYKLGRDSLKAELVGRFEKIGEQQDDDTIWIEMDEAIKIVKEL